MRAILLTSTFRRHQFVANALASCCDLAGIWQEEKTFRPAAYAQSAEDHEIIARHFAARDASESQYFTEHDRLQLGPGAVHRLVGPAGCNDSAEVAGMAALAPEVVLVFGTGILREPLLSTFAGRIINIHLGLSPYYRGSGTNFWPLVDRAPEYVGATIHYLDAGIDTGPIIAHARPDLAADDGPHDLGNKTIVAAAPLLAQAAEAHVERRVNAVPQAGGGRLRQRKDFSAAAVRQLYRNFETGMIAEYLADRARRDAALSLVTLPQPA
ncbi:MAG TPA: formyl transferase [Vicinamibacterales bacterium]|jgi:folate-dependent phosphoribosylglycinamide formyltransferase PurN